ncbi:MAG: helicase-related protein, partial [Pirellulales bacterium]
EKRLMTHARRRLGGAGKSTDDDGIAKIIDSIQNRFFDTPKAPGREALERALENIIGHFSEALAENGVKVDAIVDVMRRFLRVQTTLVRAFPIHQHDELEPHLAVRSMLDILVCSQVMGEGVDLHRYCRHVIHHDLDWNPSSIEPRTGRVDRLGCKAEHRHPIPVYLPYLAGTADKRQYRVMTDRESWFRIVMGQVEVARIIPNEEEGLNSQPPRAFQEDLVFKLGIE